MTLVIPSYAKRFSATTYKCRCDIAIVESIDGQRGKAYRFVEEPDPLDNQIITYKVGEEVRVPFKNSDRWDACGGGISFYMSRELAVLN